MNAIVFVCSLFGAVFFFCSSLYCLLVGLSLVWSGVRDRELDQFLGGLFLSLIGGVVLFALVVGMFK